MLAYLTYLSIFCFNLGKIISCVCPHQFSNMKLSISILRSFFLQSIRRLWFKISQMGVVRYINNVLLVIYEKVDQNSFPFFVWNWNRLALDSQSMPLLPLIWSEFVNGGAVALKLSIMTSLMFLFFVETNL